jgi:hypothetical protein
MTKEPKEETLSIATRPNHHTHSQFPKDPQELMSNAWTLPRQQKSQT